MDFGGGLSLSGLGRLRLFTGALHGWSVFRYDGHDCQLDRHLPAAAPGGSPSSPTPTTATSAAPCASAGWGPPHGASGTAASTGGGWTPPGSSPCWTSARARRCAR